MSKHRELGLTDYEYDLIVEKLGREPNEVELAVFSLMWSEHCGYKHSRRLLKTLPTEGPRLVLGPGENAGAVDVGDGLACAFKVESHNHPSAVEPFEGAATGVGGILRDIFAIGARPIAILDSLRFGEVATSARSRYLLERAVAGIGHYGNSIGIATVGGEIYFEGPYEQNCLVNAMALGLIETEKLIRSAAAGVGNVVVLFGAKTGRDGIGGASVLASAELDDSEDKRPSVQIGDPFTEKKLLECSLELLDRGLLVALQDLGAAGLTSSSAEMAAKGEVGLDLDVRRVPLREADMEPFEIMVSESQERMLCVVEPEQLDAVLEVCARWEVDGTAIGEVTDTRRLRVFDGDELVGDMPVGALVDECPTYALEPAEPATPLYPAPPATLHTDDPGETLVALLGSSNVASRKWAFEQYDAIVGSRTVRRPEAADAAVLLLDQTGNGAARRALAVAIDGNGRRVAADPYRGAVEAVLECSANLACVGAEPLGLTNCLNFGNPEKPHIAWQLTRAIAGLGDACRAFGIPVVGGNVSLYNEGG
ncbi:MAG TPA: phosphoribosylformylglycinamidine synthase subunit PurL, partial [Solirubrobacter sp.]|nr:phosphoribosylformylglycinamidine synthase subunit PurL [Solirubrobacter sp.]